MSTRNHSKEAKMATTARPTTDRTDTQPTLAAFRDDARAQMIRHYSQGKRPDEIADALEADLETVAGHLRRAGVLKPFDDPRALTHLYHEHGHTLETLSETFDHARGPESIRFRMEQFGIERDGSTTTKLLESMNPGDVEGLSPMQSDDSHVKFTKRGERA